MHAACCNHVWKAKAVRARDLWLRAVWLFQLPATHANEIWLLPNQTRPVKPPAGSLHFPCARWLMLVEFTRKSKAGCGRRRRRPGGGEV